MKNASLIHCTFEGDWEKIKLTGFALTGNSGILPVKISMVRKEIISWSDVPAIILPLLKNNLCSTARDSICACMCV